MGTIGKYVGVERYFSRVNQFFEGETELVSPHSLDRTELVKRTIDLELAANDLLYWQAYRARPHDTRATRIDLGILRKLEGNASETAIVPAKTLADYLGFMDYHHLDGKIDPVYQARDVLNLIRSGNLGIRLVHAPKNYQRDRRIPLMIRANQ